MRVCNKCGEAKPLSEFYLTHGVPSGKCKPCYRAVRAAGQMNSPKRTAPPGFKWCSDCRSFILLDSFGNKTGTYDGLDPICRTHRYKRHKAWIAKHPGYSSKYAKKWQQNNPERYADYLRKRSYGLAPGQYAAMLDAQGGCCAICGTTDPSPRKNFCVDHCHDTNRIRGLLCTNCNTGIGSLKHDIKTMLRAIQYLQVSTLYQP